ncbi:rab11 family-interacting protein 2-like [Rhineura floridana]|uniref:rab11 family-interacting protein 2-like n=1 Tax=Rhineura floridana TaxID=261503 RepID=UPI002AC80B6E|nr:rab11 family-interacting protein 2-like [Rhineura floridana]
MELIANQGVTRSLPVIGICFCRVDEEDTEKEQAWHPTHLQLTVLRASSLRPKGATGTSSPYVVIQLQKQKFRTSVALHSLSPEWHEECTLQLPSVLDDSEEHGLILTVMHQSLHHFNQFLGRVCLPLAQLFQDKTKRRNEWFLLQSRPGKKEKTRGQLQLDIQFLQISSQTSEPVLNSRGPWAFFSRFCGSKKGRRYKVYKEAPSQSSSLTNDEDSSSSSMTTELEASSMKSGPKCGSSLHMAAAISAGKKATSKTQLQKLISWDYKELFPDAMNLAANTAYTSQSEHPSTLEQFSSIFTQQPKKKSKPLKEERNPEAAGISMEAWQASLPPLHVAGPSDIPPRAQTLHMSTVSLQQTTSTATPSSATRHFHRCRMQLHRSYQFFRRCFGLGS